MGNVVTLAELPHILGHIPHLLQQQHKSKHATSMLGVAWNLTWQDQVVPGFDASSWLQTGQDQDPHWTGQLR